MSIAVVLSTAGLWMGFPAILSGSCAKSVAPGSDAKPRSGTQNIKLWYEGSLVGMEVGPTGAQFGHSDPNDTRYCAKFDGRETVRHCVAAHCDYLVIWARDGDYAYYDSKLLPKAPGLGARDPLRETVEEARRYKLPLIAYCVV